MPASLDGFGLGVAVKCRQQVNPNSASISAFFGVDGLQYQDGGRRGRVFFIEGLIIASTPAGVVALEHALEEFADGLPHVLTDTTGTVWFNVVYRNEYQRTTDFMMIPVQPFIAPLGGWGLQYRLLLHGLL